MSPCPTGDALATIVANLTPLPDLCLVLRAKSKPLYFLRSSSIAGIADADGKVIFKDEVAWFRMVEGGVAADLDGDGNDEVLYTVTADETHMMATITKLHVVSTSDPDGPHAYDMMLVVSGSCSSTFKLVETEGRRDVEIDGTCGPGTYQWNGRSLDPR